MRKEVNFGSSVAMSADGTRVVVGAERAQIITDDDLTDRYGAAYVFEFTGVWTQVQKIVPENENGILADNNAYFGSACAMSADGSRLVIRARYDNNASGAAYVFDYISQSKYVLQTILTPNPAKENANPGFGKYDVSCGMSKDGTKIIIGLSSYESKGAAFIFTEDNGQWSQTKLQPADLIINDYFGWSCAMSGDGTCAVVGASVQDVNPISEVGTVYIFVYDGSSWVQEQKITNEGDANARDYFGDSCAISDDGQYIAVGATNDEDGTTDSGIVYIFNRNQVGDPWEREQKIPGFMAGLYFGTSLSMSADGQRITVGTTGGSNSPGYLYVYSRDAATSTWTLETQQGSTENHILPSDPQNEAYFGWSCAMSADGEYIIAGAYKDGESPYADVGAAYIITRTPDGEWEIQ